MLRIAFVTVMVAFTIAGCAASPGQPVVPLVIQAKVLAVTHSGGSGGAAVEFVNTAGHTLSLAGQWEAMLDDGSTAKATGGCDADKSVAAGQKATCEIGWQGTAIGLRLQASDVLIRATF